MKFRKFSWVAHSDLGDGTGVLLDLKSAFYYSLNETANLLWRAFDGEEAFTDRRLARKLMESYETADLANEQILREVRDFLRELVEHELISTLPRKGNGHHAKRSSRHQHGSAGLKNDTLEKASPPAGAGNQEGTLPAAPSEEGIPAG